MAIKIQPIINLTIQNNAPGIALEDNAEGDKI